MPPKVKEQKGKIFFKAVAPVTSVIPASQKNPPRDARSYKFPEQVQPPQKGFNNNNFEFLIVSEFEALPDPEEWPSEDSLRTVDFGIDGNKQFKDNFNEWPSEISNDNQFLVWRRPKNFLRKPYMKEENWSAPMLQPMEKPQTEMDKLFFMEDRYSTLVETPQQIQEMVQAIEEQLQVCEIFERDETQEEFERRRKEQIERIAAQQAKEKKKPAKRPEEMVDEHPGKTKDVRLTDVKIESIGPDASWIGSQLQVIKDRDIRDSQSGKPLWSKIYPQLDGAPIYNPSGKYWVRLYYMGKERKIEIDDRMPCKSQIPLLPQSAIPTQLWVMLFAKAVLKLLSFQRSKMSDRSIVGDGFVMYALTGLMVETFDIERMSQNEYQIINEMIQEAHQRKKDTFVTAFNYIGRQAQTTNNLQKKRSREYYNEIVKNADKITDNFEREIYNNRNISPATNEYRDFQQTDQELKPLGPLSKYRRRRSERLLPNVDKEDTRIKSGFSYSLIELFQNETFNMVYVQKRSDREVRLRTEYYEINKANIHKMSKEEKLEHRKRKKEIRERLNEEDKRRIDLITQTVPYKLIRIKSNAQTENEQPSVYCPFSAEEIYIAKKCIANKLSKPPNYDVPEIRADDKSVVSSQFKTMQQDDAYQVKPLDDFSSLPNAIEPQRREIGGFWVLEKDLLQLFTHIQILYDPLKFPQNQVIQVPANADNEFATYDHMEMLIAEKNPEKDENSIISLVFGFQAKYPQQENIEKTLKPFSILQKFDLEQFESAHDFKVLEQYVSAQMLQFENKHNVFRLNIFSPLAYSIWTCYTNNQVRFMSIFDYLIEYELYKPKNFTIDYPSLPAKRYFNFFRFRIQVNTDCQKSIVSLVFRLRSTTDNYMLKSMRLKLCEIPPENPGNYMLHTLEGVHKNLYETVYVVQGTQRIPVRKGVVYYFLLEGQTPYPIQEGALEIEFLINSDFNINIDLLEQSEPAKYVDKYNPTKYGIIFREKIFVNDQTVASFFVRLAEIIKSEAQQQIQDSKKPVAQARGAKTAVVETQELIDTEMKESRLIKLELICNDQTILYSYGRNQAVLSNALLLPTKDEKITYILQCTFDLREWPEAKIPGSHSDSINWFLTLIGTDTIAVIRDTTKEDKEKGIKKSWEDQEPGRAERAKKARMKFFIQQKEMKGEELNEDELAIINQVRVSKKQREEEAKQQQQAQIQQKGGKVTKKDEKKAAVQKPGKKEEQTEVVQQAQRVFPQSNQHTTNEIKQLLYHLEQERLSEEYGLHAGLIYVRSEQQKKEIREHKNMAKEEATGIFHRNMQLREEIKLFQKDQKDVFTNEYQTWRSQIKDNFTEYISQRDQLRFDLGAKIKKEREIQDICKQEKPNILVEEFEKLLNDAQISNTNPKLIQVGQLVLKNLKIQALQDKLTNAVANFEIDNIRACFEIIEQNSVEGIDNDTLIKAEEILEEVNNNPNWLAEKQAELKKQGKKGKK